MLVFSFIGHPLTKLFGKTDSWREIYKQTSLALHILNNVHLQNNVLRKKMLERNIKGRLFINLLRFTPLGLE